MSNLTDKDAAFRALNQLCSVLSGRRWARETDSLKADPAQRIQSCMQFTLEEARQASLEMLGSPDGDKVMAQANRKIDSLQSLAVLARIIQTEVDWND